MKSIQSIEGKAFRLRPVEMRDAAFIVWLRVQENLSRYVNPISGNLEDQERWIANYLARDNDYYFIIERITDGRQEGAISLYDVHAEGEGTAEWGRWVLRPGSLAAVESALLIYRYAFEVLGLKKTHCRTVAANTRVVSFHDSCGITNRQVLKDFVTIGGELQDSVEHSVFENEWSTVAARLQPLSDKTAVLALRQTV